MLFEISSPPSGLPRDSADIQLSKLQTDETIRPPDVYKSVITRLLQRLLEFKMRSKAVHVNSELTIF